ncbi:MAG: hypothetical protein ACRCW1_09740 [Anaerotignaceae bacterium]
MKNKTGFFHLIMCFIVVITILSFRQVFVYPQEIVVICHTLLNTFLNIMDALNLMVVLKFIEGVPSVILLTALGIFSVMIGFIVLKFKEEEAKYATVALKSEVSKVIRYGLIFFCAKYILFIIFLYSVVGIPIAVGIIAITTILEIIGGIPVAIAIGGCIQDLVNGNDRRVTYNYTIGALAILFCINVYAVGCTFFLFVFPVLSYGTFVLNMENRIFKRTYKDLECFNGKYSFDRRKIKDIITKGL